jgi:hypothetical protein
MIEMTWNDFMSDIKPVIITSGFVINVKRADTHQILLFTDLCVFQNTYTQVY